ncbi:MAG: PilT/PilU family type 4a pilus ATPase, partial [Myxococcales bacterium]|nr:PilT/PilU family type 4a pilus ATPase [Myxococcales bacterium]
PPPPPKAGTVSRRSSKPPKSLVPAAPMRPPRRRNPQDEAARVDWLQRVLTHAVAGRASDVHLHAGAPVQLRIRGQLLPMSRDILTPENAEVTLRASLTDEQLDVLDETGEVDFAYELAQVGRFRASIYEQHAGLCGVYHHIAPEPPSMEELGLPTSLARLTSHRTGLVLVAGPSGSGKTSTMAALIAHMNEERSDHILSLEDPIEFVHESHRCLVNQREVNRHTHSFSAALRSALREDPDVICIGELRDQLTISLALSAAETGHLVIATMHTLGAIRTINRLIGAFPSGQQGQIRAMLSESLRAVISQQLLPSADGQRMLLAYELLIITQAAGNLIRENRTFQLASVMQTGRQQGMRSIDDSLAELLRAGRITKDVACEFAETPSNFK